MSQHTNYKKVCIKDVGCTCPLCSICMGSCFISLPTTGILPLSLPLLSSLLPLSPVHPPLPPSLSLFFHLFHPTIAHPLSPDSKKGKLPALLCASIYLISNHIHCTHVISLSTGPNWRPGVKVHVRGGAMLPVALLVLLLGSNTHCCWWNVVALMRQYSKTCGFWMLREGCGIRQATGCDTCRIVYCPCLGSVCRKWSVGFVHVQVTLPKSLEPRCSHTATMFSLGPSVRVLVLFGGRRRVDGEPVAETTLLYFGECTPSTSNLMCALDQDICALKWLHSAILITFVTLTKLT